MRVRMKTRAIGPNTPELLPDKEYDLEDGFAKDLLAGGYAAPVSADHIETAALAGAPETAVGKRQRKAAAA